MPRGYKAHMEPVYVRLACGHDMYVRPSHKPVPGKLVYCIRCFKESHMPFPMKTDVDGKPVPGDWEWRCESGQRCHGGSRQHGNSRENALYAGSRHSRSHPGHEVWLIDPYGVVKERWGGSVDSAGEPLWRDGVAAWVRPEHGGRKVLDDNGSEIPF